MIEIVPSSNVGVFGPVASGKTNLLNQWLAASNRYVRFDYTGETMANPEAIEHFHAPRPLLERLQANPYFFRIAYHPGKNVMEHYRWCQRAIWLLDTPRWLVMDEFHRVCPQTMKLDEDVESALRLARHNQLGIICASQRPQDVSKLFVDSCRMCVVFRSQEENFLNACAGHWGGDVAEAIESLRPLVYDDVSKQVKQLQQCVVITRDGNAARIFDFASQQYIPLDTFLSEETEPIQNGALRTDLDAEGASSESVPDGAGDTDNGATV